MRSAILVIAACLALALHAQTDSVAAPTIDDEIDWAATQLGCDPAAIHAVVDIEAGHIHDGFWGPGKPVIHFSFNQFKKYAAKRGINVESHRKTHPVLFQSPDRSKHGGSAMKAMKARLDQAMAIDSVAAIQATFWGMMQIAGFNWKLCGASSPQEFCRQMEGDNHTQMQLFVNFLRSTRLDEPLRQHNWARFARGYNGPSYASRGYHTRLARAYAKRKAQAR